MSTTTQNTRKKNLLTSIVAGAAGIALLAGGASFALWTDSQDSAQASISSGSLSIDANTQTWTNVTTGALISSADVAAHKLVPGDTIRLDQVFTTKVDGNITAALTVSNPAKAIDGTLADDVNCVIGVNDVTALSGSCATVLSQFTGDVVLADSVTASTTKISLTVSFPKTTSTTQGGMNEVLNVKPVTFALTQK